MSGFITGRQARLLLEEGAQLIDVRNPSEFMRGAAPGAQNVPLHLLPIKASELDAEKPIIVYCMSGGRSAQAQMLLQGLGFSSVHNVGNIQNLMA